MTLYTDNQPTGTRSSLLAQLRRDWSANGWNSADLAHYRMDGSGEGAGGQGGSGGASGDGGAGGSGSGGTGSGSGTDQPRSFSQEDVNRIMAAEKEQGRRAAASELAEKLGMTPDEAKAVIEAHKEAEKGKLTEAERREKEAAEAKAKSDKAAADAAETRKLANIERALIRAHVSDESLDYAVRMVLPDVADDATAEQITDAVEKAKKAVPALFAPSGNGNGHRATDGDPNGAPPNRRGADGMTPLERGRERAQREREARQKQNADPFAGMTRI